jgi:DNA-binding response OmpR family regulator
VPTVLLADNDRAVSALLTEILAHAGFAVVHAHDGEQARAMARQPGLDVVVCDLDMPRMSGLEVLESMQGLAAVPPVVVISGYLDHGIMQRLTSLPYVRDVLRKPFDLLAFAARIRQLATSAAPDGAARSAM